MARLEVNGVTCGPNSESSCASVVIISSYADAKSKQAGSTQPPITVTNVDDEESSKWYFCPSPWRKDCDVLKT